jgi:hypothetical protein
MDEVILMLKQATGGPTLHSGAFPLSGEIRLGGTQAGVTGPGRLVGTPSQPFVAGTHPLVATPSAGFSVSGSRSNMMPVGSQGFAVPQGAPMPTPSQAPQPAASSWFPRVAVIGALAIAGGFLALRFSEHQQGVTAAPPGVVEPKATTPGTPSAATPGAQGATPGGTVAEATQAHVFVRLTSNPSGARVLVDGKPYGPTPADIELWGEIAEKGKEVTFLFEKEGFESVSVQRRIVDEKFSVDAALSRDAATRRREAQRERPRTSPTNGPVVVTPDNFKEDPY